MFPLIDFEITDKSYGDNKVYENFRLSVEEKKITCILGESGCGKTTLLNIIAGLTDYKGEIPRLKCSYVFQTPRLVPNLTVRGNLALTCADGVRVEAVIERMRLKDKADSYPVSLSGGQAQRVALARALLFDGDIMLLDEPFSSLDLKLKREIIQLFCETIKEAGKTALFVTHDIDEAAALAQRIVVIKGGKIVYDSTPEYDVPRSLGQCGQLRYKLLEVMSD